MRRRKTLRRERSVVYNVVATNGSLLVISKRNKGKTRWSMSEGTVFPTYERAVNAIKRYNIKATVKEANANETLPQV